MYVFVYAELPVGNTAGLRSLLSSLTGYVALYYNFSSSANDNILATMSNKNSDPTTLKRPATTPASDTSRATSTQSPIDPSIRIFLSNLQSNTSNDDHETPQQPKCQKNLVLTPELFEHLLRPHSQGFCHLKQAQ
jgi:hypothetical protein